MSKRNSLYVFESDATSAAFNMADGSAISVVFDNLTPETRYALMVHGWKQKVADAAAIPCDPDTGRSATAAEKVAAMSAVAGRLEVGEWNAAKGEGGGSGGLLLRALMEVYPTKTREQLVEYLAKRSTKEQNALRRNAKIAPVIERLRTVKADASIDTNEMLDELENDE